MRPEFEKKWFLLRENHKKTACRVRGRETCSEGSNVFAMAGKSDLSVFRAMGSLSSASVAQAKSQQADPDRRDPDRRQIGRHC